MKYEIKLRVKNRWWWRDPKIFYDLIKIEEHKIWTDPSYGNGGGCFMDITDRQVVKTSEDVQEVINLKKELEKL